MQLRLVATEFHAVSIVFKFHLISKRLFVAYIYILDKKQLKTNKMFLNFLNIRFEVALINYVSYVQTIKNNKQLCHKKYRKVRQKVKFVSQL